jgi:hypothetical protein
LDSDNLLSTFLIQSDWKLLFKCHHDFNLHEQGYKINSTTKPYTSKCITCCGRKQVKYFESYKIDMCHWTRSTGNSFHWQLTNSTLSCHCWPDKQSSTKKNQSSEYKK